MLNRIVALLLCGFALPVTSFGWGREGHRVVAKIAAKNSLRVLSVEGSVWVLDVCFYWHSGIDQIDDQTCPTS